MKEFKISVPEGYEIDQKKSTFENIVFKTVLKDIISEIQTIEDIFRLNNTSQKEFDKKWKGFENYEKAQALEILIVKAYNQGWYPNWNNSNEYKYLPYFTGNEEDFRCSDCNCWCTYSFTSSRLFFKSENLLLDATSKFLSVYKESRL